MAVCVLYTVPGMKRKKQKRIVLRLSIVLAALIAVAVILKNRPTPSNQTQMQHITEIEQLPPPAANVYTPMDFGYEGDYLTCLTDESILGIDVSTFQKEIDWKKVKDAGIEYAMIRLGGRGYGENGNIYKDSWADTNYEKATAQGIKVGVYFFSQAITVQEAVEEAEFVLQQIKDWQLDMPVAFDWECLADDYRTMVADARLTTDCAKAFCDKIEEAGYDSMVYFNPNQSRTQMYLAELVDYGFWLAMYSDQMTYEYKVDMWQYTNEGKVPGIKGKVDINLYFPYEEG